MQRDQAMRHSASARALLALWLLCPPAAADSASEGGPANPAAATALLEYDSGLARMPAADPPALPWGVVAVRQSAQHNAGAAQADTLARVLSVNRRTGEVLLEHGPIARLHMPAMTMQFRAASAAVLRQLREGERVGVAIAPAGPDMLVTAVFKP
ncbi:copper-binding protein [Noviherbaspirillum sp. L7-7A]|uniref:copper-binding protein n=1 Tax=Noviherbaspirillum sp. L7-7A TaxID=2850560 RepID=UPI001C2C3198|nr:copper-binding protein [Noviherbaspirillum sp. L7-7A]MBV0881281.1 copper-binding protein [Noviherbaspirillum sp. L7-7A]